MRFTYFSEIWERLMTAMRGIGWVILLGTVFLTAADVSGQIVINELVDDERTATSGQVRPDAREFVELYNAGAAPVDISGWQLNVIQIGLVPLAPATTTYTIPAAQSIAAGDYYVIAKAGSTVPNVDFAPTALIPHGTGFDLFPEDAAGGGTNTPTANFVLELRNGATLVDAMALETFRDPEISTLTAEQLAQVGIGYWGQTISNNAGTANPLPQSLSRWRDGRDTNFNGRDFGFIPITPGTTNNILPQNAAHTIPNVDALSDGTALHTNYYTSFINARVVDPANPDGLISQEAFDPSPQGGKAIMAYDQTGGGNVVYSKELVNKFDLYAFIETNTLNVNGGHEATVYGIGTSDPFFGTPNSAGINTLTSTANGSTGIGWLIQRGDIDATAGINTKTVLQLVHFDDGGDSLPADGDWTILEEFTLPADQRTWHRLGIDYDPDTGEVVATHDGNTYTHNIGGAPEGDENGDGIVDAADYVALRKLGQATTDWETNFGSTGGSVELLGTFYAGWRENHGNNVAEGRPPTFDMVGGGGGGAVPEPGSIALVLIGLVAAAVGRRRA
jgi:hypothetical protein